MTTRSWIFARVVVSGSSTAPYRARFVSVCLLLLGALLFAPRPSQAQTLGNFCPNGTCDITNPNFVNVYWDSSLAQWDADVAANTTDMAHDHLDHLTEALVHSEYFVNTSMFGDGALNQYSVTGATFGGSIAAGGCLAAASTLDKARSDLPTLVNCILAAHPSLKADNTILNVFVPPQSMQVQGICQGEGERAEHGQYGTAVGVTFLPTAKACGDLSGLFSAVTHEMVEATTDPNPPSPTGWKDGSPGDFYGQEAGDLCEKTKTASVGFLFSSVSTYWSDLSAKCSSGFPLSVPNVSKATACGAGQNMTFTLTGFFGPTPWDLASKKFGTQTLYLNLLVKHGGKIWEAGNFEGLPNKDWNGGKPDVVHFGASGVNWSANTITVSGFDNNYGKTMANGAVAKVSPGDQIILNLAMQESGQFLATSAVTAPSASQILNLAVTPTGGDPWVFVNKQADVSGTVADAGNCAVESQLVSLFGYQGAVNPGSAGTSATGEFQSTYFAPGVAGTQKVQANLANNNSVTASVPVPVHPILNSVTPNLGPVAGGQSATLAGDGFDPGNTTAAFGGAAAQVGTVSLNTIQAVTPHSPLGGDGDGTVDVIATVNGLDSQGVPYQYILPGKPYISFKSTGCKTHYIVVTVYDDNAKPVSVPIQLTAGYAAYFSNGQWVASMNTTSGVSVQVDKGGPFTATNLNNKKSTTASFPVLPEGICDNVKLVTKVDWHIFEKPGEWIQHEVSQINPGAKAGTGGKKVVIWTRGANVKDATTTVLDPAGTPGGGGLRVSTVGAERLRGALRGGIFLSGGGMKTESAPGEPAGSVREVQFAGPAISISRAGQSEDAVAPLGRELRLTFGLPQGYSNPHAFHIVHLTMLDGQATWVEDGKSQTFPYNSGLSRIVDQSGIYVLLEVVGRAIESEPKPSPSMEANPYQPRTPSLRETPAPQGSTVLVPSGAFPGGVLTGVVLGPDDKPVPNTPVTIAGGVPITLTGVVIGEEQPTTPQQPPPCQPDAAGNLPPGCPPEQPPPCQPDPTTGLLPPGCAPPTVNQLSDCARILSQYTGPTLPQPGVTPTGAVPGAAGGSGGRPLLTDANGRFAMCVPIDAPKVDVTLNGGTRTTVPTVTGTPALPGAPPSFFQPSQRVSLIGLLRDLKADQGGHTWLLPAVYAISGNGKETLTTFLTPRDAEPGPIQLSYTGNTRQIHHVQGNIFRIVRATLDRSQLRSDQGATFEYEVQFGGQAGQNLCVEMQVGGPVVMVQPPPEIIVVDANGMGRFSGRIRATQVAPGSVVPFELTPNIHVCSQ